MNLFTSLTLLLGVVFFIGCSEDIPTSDLYKAKLFGKWNWVYSTNLGGIKTPETEGKIIVREFTPSGYYRVYQNDTLIVDEPFELIEVKDENTGIIVTMDTIDGIGIIGFDTKCEVIGDSLFTSLYRVNDSYGISAYVRKR